MNNKVKTNLFTRLPLRSVLIVPFVLLTVLVVGLVGYLSFRNGQQAVNEVAHQLRVEITGRIESYVRTFLETPHRINQLNADALQEEWLVADDPSALERHLWKQIQNFPTVSSIYFGNPAGGLVDAGREGAQDRLYVIATEGFTQGPLYKYATDERGQRAELLLTVPKFDARTRPWYTAALNQNGPTWSEVYILSTGQDLAVAASRPVYDDQQKLLGVVSVDIFLSHLSNFLKNLSIGKTGQSFIMDHSGLLIASSIDEKPFNTPNGKSAPQRLLASQSTSPLIRTAATSLSQQFDDYTHLTSEQQLEFELDGQRHFVSLTPVHTDEGIDWFIVVIVPEADFMAQINDTNRSTVTLSALALLITIIFGFVATGWITQPIARLKVAVHDLAKGEWQPIPSTGRIDEIEELTYAFNHMAEQLHQMVNSLTAEVAARQQAEATLHNQLEFVNTLLETIPNPVFYKDLAGRYTGCNRAFEEFIGRSRDEIIGQPVHAMGPEHLIAKYDEMDKALLMNPGTQTYEWHILNSHGEKRSIIFNKATTHDTAGNVNGLVGIITDITERKQMEIRQQELLAEREQLVQRLQLILECMPIACILSDLEFRITYWNPAAERIFGYTAGEAMGQLPHQLLVSPEVQSYVQEIEERLRQGDMSAHGENENLTKDGRTIICQWHNIPLVDPDGAIVGNLGMVQDVTERKQAERALRESQERLDMVVKGAELGTWDWHLPSDQAVFNERWAEMLGYSLAEIEPRVGEWQKLVHPDDLPAVMKAMQAHLTGQAPIYQTEHRLRAKSGEWKWILDTGKIIVWDEQGQPVRAVGIHQDINERKAAEESLHRYERMVSAAPDLMSLVSRDYVYLIVNQAYLSVTGKSYEQIVGHTIAQVMGDVIFQTNKPYLDRTLAGETVQFERWIDYPLAGRRFVSQTYTPYVETDGTISSLVVSRRDLTDLKLLEEQLRDAQKMEAVGQLAAGMAHHYNSMLTAIIGFTSLSLRKLPPGDPVAKHLNRVMSTAERAAVLVRQLLAFARKQLLQPKTVNLNELVLNLKDKLDPRLNESIELRLSLAPDLGLVNMDPNQFEHLLYSLVSNACDAMPDDGCLTLITANVSLSSVEADLYQLIAGEYVLLTVQDTGMGLTDEVKAHLFEPFFTTKDIGQGTGLGLAMSLGIAKQHGGHLFAESQPGQGATFTVYLPRVTYPIPITTQPDAASLPSGNETILLVEDEPAVRELVAQVLTQQGYTVFNATDGEAALQLMANQVEHVPQLLLTNLVMRGLSGYSLVERLRTSYPGLKVLFFFESTGDDPQTSQPAIDFLAKPFKPSSLVQKVRTVLSTVVPPVAPSRG